MPAMKFTPIARLRTVRPKTSPNTWVTRQPGTSFMVEIRMGNCGGALGWDMFPDRRRALSLSDSVFGARCPTVTSVSDDVLVIGAGVIGLTTAVCLAEAGVRTRVMSTDLPRETTSAMAGAMWGPAFAEPADRALAWSRVGLDEFTRLARDPATGVRITRGRMASRAVLALDDLPPQVAMVPGLVECGRGELPAGFASGQWARVPLIDMPRYLGYLTGRLTAAGGRLDIRTVSRLSEAVD